MAENDANTELDRVQVDGDIIHEVAKSHSFGAGALKGALRFPERERDDRMEKAMKEAYHRQCERDGVEPVW